MIAVIQPCHPGVIPVNRQQVLGQVVAPHRQKINPTGKLTYLVYGRGNFYHHPYLGLDELMPVINQLFKRLVNQRRRLVYLNHT